MDAVLRATTEYGRHNCTAKGRGHADEGNAGHGWWGCERWNARNARSSTSRYAWHGPDDADDVAGHGSEQDGHESIHVADGWRYAGRSGWYARRTRRTHATATRRLRRTIRRPIASPTRTIPTTFRAQWWTGLWSEHEHGRDEPAADCYHAAGAIRHGRPRWWWARQRREKRKGWLLLIHAEPKQPARRSRRCVCTRKSLRTTVEDYLWI